MHIKMEQYSNNYSFEEFLFRDNFYRASVWVSTDIDERIVEDWGYKIDKLELYDREYVLQVVIENPTDNMFDLYQLHKLEGWLMLDYYSWLANKDDPDWYRELWLSDYI